MGRVFGLIVVLPMHLQTQGAVKKGRKKPKNETPKYIFDLIQTGRCLIDRFNLKNTLICDAGTKIFWCKESSLKRRKFNETFYDHFMFITTLRMPFMSVWGLCYGCP
jgi:hypothetical protein